MSATTPAIRSVTARAVIAPISRPVKNAFGVIEAAPLVLIDVVTDQGITGRSYIFAYARLTLKPLVHLIEEIGRDLTGRAIAPLDLMTAMDAKFRLLGWQGLVGMAVSGLDMAFWDALAQVAGLPLVKLLGGSSRPIPAYDSYGVVDPIADEKDLRRSLDQGFRGIKIKGGDGGSDPPHCPVGAVRSALDRRACGAGKSQRSRHGARDFADLDPGRRELVVSTRFCRSDRRRRQRFHHA